MRVGCRACGAQRAEDPLAGEWVDEAGCVADQQPARTGGCGHPMADRRGAADRREARAAGQAVGDGGQCLDRLIEARGGGPATIGQWQGHADVQLPTRRRGQADVVARSDVHLAMVDQVGHAGVVGDQAEPAREAHRPLDAEQPRRPSSARHRRR